MNWKLIVLGGLAFYVTMFVIAMATGPLLHEGILDPLYMENSSFWRPELNQDPPDMASLMPRWITVGLLMAFVQVALYGWIRGGFSGAPWQKGMKYGLLLSILGCGFMAGFSGIFNLPEKLWLWWGAEQFFYYLPGGAVLGWLGGKLAPEGA
ncbi:MAG: hypothetical protein ACE5GX_19965 [Thermoanaerobaculia bacterium]